jgi:hypothetical protein
MLRKSMIQLVTGEWWISMTYRRTRETYLCVLVMILGVLVIAAPVAAYETPASKPFSCPADAQNLTTASGELVGCVAVTNDNSYLYVNFSSSPSVQLTKASWGWSTFIPTDSIGNPVPVAFSHTQTFTNGVQTFTFPGEDISEVLGTDAVSIYLSAYAVVEEKNVKTCTWISSDGTETYTAYNNPKLGPDIPGTPSPRSGTAVIATVSPWHNPSLYLGTTRTPFTFKFGKWIWESKLVKNPYKGDIVDFTKTFTLNGDPVSGTIWITADDGYDMSLNGLPVGKEGLNNGWRSSVSTLKYAYVPGHGLWKSVEQYDLTKTVGKLAKGTNTLFIQTANRYMGCDNYLPAGVKASDSDFDTGPAGGSQIVVVGGDLVACGGSCAEPKGTTSTNIGALIFEANICTEASSTQDAWALTPDGSKIFEYTVKKVTITLSPFNQKLSLPDQTVLTITATVEDRSTELPGEPLVFATDFGSLKGGTPNVTAITDSSGVAAVIISSSAPGTANLIAWIDANGNGILDPGEWSSSDPVTWLAAPTIAPAIETAVEPTIEPVADPTIEPVADPTIEPAADPTIEPVADPTIEPVADPTIEPVADPTIAPVADPTIEQPTG